MLKISKKEFYEFLQSLKKEDINFFRRHDTLNIRLFLDMAFFDFQTIEDLNNTFIYPEGSQNTNGCASAIFTRFLAKKCFEAYPFLKVSEILEFTNQEIRDPDLLDELNKNPNYLIKTHYSLSTCRVLDAILANYYISKHTDTKEITPISFTDL